MSWRPVVEQREAIATDGTRIGYQVRGSGPCIVLANGLGGTYLAFRHLYDWLGDRYRVISWDYRGLYTSGPAADPRANTIAHQVADLMVILEQEGISEVVLAGWSMGVQVALETIRRHPARVKGLFMINGTYGHAFRTVLGSRFIGTIVPTALKLVRAQAGLVGRATRLVAGRDAVITAMKVLGLVGKSIDMDVFRAVAAGFIGIDWVIYSDLLSRLDEHDAEDVLATIQVPVTIVTGDRDLMTPPATAEHIHRSIPQSRLVLIKGASHYTPVEHPVKVVEELASLLERIPGWERQVRP